MRPRLMVAAAVAAALALAGCNGAATGGAPAPSRATTTATGPAAAAPSAEAASHGADDTGAPGPNVILVRRAGGVPDSWGARLRRIPGVAAVTRATRAQALLRAIGARRVRAGFAVPLDTLVIRPRGYARMLPAGERAPLARLGPGRALLSRSSARLRRARDGSTLTLAGACALPASCPTGSCGRPSSS